MITKILFFTLSNFGDVVLTLPVLDILRANYPTAGITVMVGPRAADVFKNNPHLHNIIIYDKYAPLKDKIKLFFQINKEHFDVVIDLRNTLFGALLPVRFKTSPFLPMPVHIRHMKNQNLYRLKKALRYKEPLKEVNPVRDRPPEAAVRHQRCLVSNGVKGMSLYVSQEDEKYINTLLQESGINREDKIVIVSPATGGRTRRWGREKFIQLCRRLAKDYSVILIGREDDKTLLQSIKVNCAGKILDFAGLTSLAQLAFLLRISSLVVVCDTGLLHLASYSDVPIIAMFGPSDEQRYGPWSSKFKVITAGVSCRPCRKPECKFTSLEVPPCMQEISVNEVLDSIDGLLKL